MYRFTKEELFDLYETQKMSANAIAQKFNCNHKTIRKYLKQFGLLNRTASEYNFLCRKGFVEPTGQELFCPLSIKAHMAYWCEGHHTSSAKFLSFCNTNPNLIEQFVRCLRDVYQQQNMSFNIVLSDESERAFFEKEYPKAVYIIDRAKKCPLIHVKVGGKNLAHLFIGNAKMIIETLMKEEPLQ